MLAAQLLRALLAAHAGVHRTMTSGKAPSVEEADGVAQSLYALQREAVSILKCLGPEGQGNDERADAIAAAAAAVTGDRVVRAVAGFLLNSDPAHKAALRTQMEAVQRFIAFAAGPSARAAEPQAVQGGE